MSCVRPRFGLMPGQVKVHIVQIGELPDSLRDGVRQCPSISMAALRKFLRITGLACASSRSLAKQDDIIAALGYGNRKRDCVNLC